MRETQINSIGELGAVARSFVQEHCNGAAVGLSGELGAGKTTFVRCCVEALASLSRVDPPRVISPSFVLHQRYELIRPVEHFDLYRLDELEAPALVEIGYFDALERIRQDRGFLFVEWPERASASLSLDFTLVFQVLGDKRVLQSRK